MAIRREDLGYTSPGRVLRFPTERADARLRRQKVVEGRRRLALIVAALAVVAGVALGGGGAAAVESRPDAPQTVVLQPGDTLWGVASEFAAPGSDPRAYVDSLQELNGIEAVVRAGMQLSLPPGAPPS